MVHRRGLLIFSSVLLSFGCSTPPKYQPTLASPEAVSSSPLTASKKQDVVIQAIAMLDRRYT